MLDIEQMNHSVETECKDMDENIGISVVLWRLKELIKGYQFAVKAGYHGR